MSKPCPPPSHRPVVPRRGGLFRVEASTLSGHAECQTVRAQVHSISSQVRIKPPSNHIQNSCNSKTCTAHRNQRKLAVNLPSEAQHIPFQQLTSKLAFTHSNPTSQTKPTAYPAFPIRTPCLPPSLFPSAPSLLPINADDSPRLDGSGGSSPMQWNSVACVASCTRTVKTECMLSHWNGRGMPIAGRICSACCIQAVIESSARIQANWRIRMRGTREELLLLGKMKECRVTVPLHAALSSIYPTPNSFPSNYLPVYSISNNLILFSYPHAHKALILAATLPLSISGTSSPNLNPNLPFLPPSSQSKPLSPHPHLRSKTYEAIKQAHNP
ncbi:uncharacterized protein BDR25DRAFT_355418 [Lindgomyces ingoldianus]|uniref:Uncharacterized protein n=1 Tax=Lindgomyces ingoldianus TaxID=673940 RepID=A0ACB6QW59_9PLEO|nr:uncharacterized protein BDR25DRAFT_355418 [Lindgomyces ingoldianus]KAF2470302.1 hypothetical protein BDR25DRAFT_355418 [Lindgomyces ingoldianus]